VGSFPILDSVLGYSAAMFQLHRSWRPWIASMEWFRGKWSWHCPDIRLQETEENS